MDYSFLTPRSFAEQVLGFAVNELRWLPDYTFHEIIGSEIKPVIEDIGKAVTIFGILQQRRVRLRLKKIKHQLLRSRCSFSCFAFNFSNSFFKRKTKLDKYLLVKFLCFCGVVSELALFSFRNGRSAFMDICGDVVEETIVANFDDIQAAGGWKRLHALSTSFADFYDFTFREVLVDTF